MATILYADNSCTDVRPKNGRDFKLGELNKIVGGYIDIVNLRNGKILVVNEEGKLDNLPYNAQATNIARNAGVIFTNDYIVGDVLYCDDNQVK